MKNLTLLEKVKFTFTVLAGLWLITSQVLSIMYLTNWKVEIRPNVESFEVVSAVEIATTSAVLNK